MDLNDKSKQKRTSLLKSFSYAINGIRTAVREERNMRIHVVSSVIVVIFSIIFSLSAEEWLIITLLIAGMFALELVNTAIERIVNLVTREYHPLAKQAKDLAAGAVFVYALAAIVIGVIIFGPPILRFFQLPPFDVLLQKIR